MPGTEDRDPSAADRPPASRVGDELQKAADDIGAEAGTLSSKEVEELERGARERAEDLQWDQAATEDEGGSGKPTPSPAEAARNRAEDPPA